MKRVRVGVLWRVNRRVKWADGPVPGDADDRRDCDDRAGRRQRAPDCRGGAALGGAGFAAVGADEGEVGGDEFGGDQSRSEEHTSELQSLMRISYDVFCLKKKRNTRNE